MKKKYDLDMPSGKIVRIPDFLPSPAELMAAEKTVKVTLRLSESSVALFKSYANRYHTKYQKVIRRLVDTYANKYIVRDKQAS